MAQFANTTISGNTTSGTEAHDFLVTQLTDNGWTNVETVWVAGSMTGTMSGAATASATSTVLTRNGGVNWSASSGLRDMRIRFTSGTGSGTTAIVTNNTTTTLTVASWPVQPDATSVFDLERRWTVLKSPSASNTVGTDFYIALSPAQSTASEAIVYVSLFETWDDVNKKAIKYAPTSGTGLALAADGTVADAVGLAVNSGSIRRAYMNLLYGSTSVFYTDTTVDRLIFGTTNTGGTYPWPIYVGVFDSALPVTMDPVPLCLSGLQYAVSGGINGGGTTREPNTAIQATNNWCIQWTANSVDSGYFTPTVNGSALVPSYGDIYRGNSVTARMMLVSSRQVGYSGNSASGLRGVYKSIITSNTATTRGDTLTETRLDGSTRTYVQVGGIGAGLKVLIRTS